MNSRRPRPVSPAKAVRVTSVGTLLLSVVVCIPANAAGSAATPERLPLHQITYAASFKGISIGTITLQLQASGDHYSYQTLAHPSWLARVAVSQSTQERSEFTLNSDGVLPLEYSLGDPEKPGLGNRYHYDWDHLVVSGKHDDKAVSFPLNAPTYDPLSIRAQLLFDFARGKTQMSYRMLDGDEVKSFVYRRQNAERVQTSWGPINAVRWDSAKENAAPNDRQWRYWLAPEYGFLPLEIEQVQDGKSRLLFKVTQLVWTDPKTAKTQVLGNVTPR